MDPVEPESLRMARRRRVGIDEPAPESATVMGTTVFSVFLM